MGTHPDILKHFHSILHKAVSGTLSCRERMRPCEKLRPGKHETPNIHSEKVWEALERG